MTEAEQEDADALGISNADCGHSESVARLGRSSHSPRTHTSPVHRRRLTSDRAVAGEPVMTGRIVAAYFETAIRVR